MSVQKVKVKHARKTNKHLSFHLNFFSFTVFNKTEFTIKLNLQCVVSPAYLITHPKIKTFKFPSVNKRETVKTKKVFSDQFIWTHKSTAAIPLIQTKKQNKKKTQSVANYTSYLITSCNGLPAYSPAWKRTAGRFQNHAEISACAHQRSVGSWDLLRLEHSCCTTNERLSLLQLPQCFPSETKEDPLQAHRHINYQVMCINLKNINFHIICLNKCNMESYKSLYLISSNGKEESNQKCNICSQYTLLLLL